MKKKRADLPSSQQGLCRDHNRRRCRRRRFLRFPRHFHKCCSGADRFFPPGTARGVGARSWSTHQGGQKPCHSDGGWSRPRVEPRSWTGRGLQARRSAASRVRSRCDGGSSAGDEGDPGGETPGSDEQQSAGATEESWSNLMWRGGFSNLVSTIRFHAYLSTSLAELRYNQLEIKIKL